MKSGREVERENTISMSLLEVPWGFGGSLQSQSTAYVTFAWLLLLTRDALIRDVEAAIWDLIAIANDDAAVIRFFRYFRYIAPGSAARCSNKSTFTL